MEGGLLTIEGSAGMHLGAAMAGGEIRVRGRVDDWLGAGNEGRPDLGGRERRPAGGLRLPGREAGHDRRDNYHRRVGGGRGGGRMRRGLIVVTGDCGDFPGAEMRAGTIMVYGNHAQAA